MTAMPERAAFRVLLVEDDPDHAELVRRALEDQDARVAITVKDDGEAGLEYLRAQAASPGPEDLPHLVLLDLRLPKMDGLQLLREIKAQPALCGIPCVVLTTSEAERDMVSAYALHVNSYLVKPGDHDRFARLIADVERYWAGSNRQPSPVPRVV